MYAFENSVSCFFTISQSLMCDTANRAKLEVISDQIVAGKWIHMVLSIQSSGSAYLLLHDNSKVIAVDEVTDFALI